MRCLALVPCLLLVACGTEPNTSITTDGASSTSLGGSSGPMTTGEPTTVTGTGGTGDLTGDSTTGGQGGTGSTGSTGSTGDATTGEQISTTTTVGTETATTSTTTTGEAQTTGEVQTTGDPGFVDCATLKADYQAELAELRSCVDASECGQDLKGTSCGCTHNAVARLDADATKLYGLLMLADEHGCELILAGTCDCPAADGFVCTNGSCGWNYL